MLLTLFLLAPSVGVPAALAAIVTHGFGFDPEDVDDFLCDYGWHVLEHLGYEELADRYVEPTGRKLEFMAIERIVYAEKLKSG